MGGVDRLDQLRAYYSVGRASIRWEEWTGSTNCAPTTVWVMPASGGGSTSSGGGGLKIGIINAYILLKMSNHHLPPKFRFMSLKSWKIRLLTIQATGTAMFARLVGLAKALLTTQATGTAMFARLVGLAKALLTIQATGASMFAQLSSLAKVLLTIPNSSAAPERTLW